MTSNGLVEFRIRDSKGYIGSEWFENDGRYRDLRVTEGVSLRGAVYRIYRIDKNTFHVTDPEFCDVMFKKDPEYKRLFVVRKLTDLEPVASETQMSASSGE